jgi:restriction system protein
MLKAARVLLRAIAFPLRFRAVRGLGAIAVPVAGLGVAVATGLARWTDIGGGAFTALFIVAYTCAIAGVVIVALALRRWGARRARTLEELLALSPAAFEAAVARILRQRGYREVSVVGGPGDLAADILCRDGQGRSVAVQCKRKAPGQRVGSAEMQQFIGMIAVHHQADGGIYVTTSSFTRPAAGLAGAHGITLIDGEALARMVVRASGRGARRVRRAA